MTAIALLSAALAVAARTSTMATRVSGYDAAGGPGAERALTAPVSSADLTPAMSSWSRRAS